MGLVGRREYRKHTNLEALDRGIFTIPDTFQVLRDHMEIS